MRSCRVSKLQLHFLSEHLFSVKAIPADSCIIWFFNGIRSSVNTQEWHLEARRWSQTEKFAQANQWFDLLVKVYNTKTVPASHVCIKLTFAFNPFAPPHTLARVVPMESMRWSSERFASEMRKTFLWKCSVFSFGFDEGNYEFTVRWIN